MENKEEFGGSDMNNKYCVYCCDESGMLKPYEDVLKGMIYFAKKSMGISEEEAIKVAKENMAKLPAWSDFS